MTRTEKENLVPVWERITISLEEAAAYSGIGVRKLRDMTDKPEFRLFSVAVWPIQWLRPSRFITRFMYQTLKV